MRLQTILLSITKYTNKYNVICKSCVKITGLYYYMKLYPVVQKGLQIWKKNCFKIYWINFQYIPLTILLHLIVFNVIK